MKTWKRWSREDTKYLIRNYATTPTPELAEELARSVASIHCKAQEVGLVGNKNSQPHKFLINIKSEPFDQWNISQFVVEYYKNDT